MRLIGNPPEIANRTFLTWYLQNQKFCNWICCLVLSLNMADRSIIGLPSLSQFQIHYMCTPKINTQSKYSLFSIHSTFTTISVPHLEKYAPCRIKPLTIISSKLKILRERVATILWEPKFALSIFVNGGKPRFSTFPEYPDYLCKHTNTKKKEITKYLQ